MVYSRSSAHSPSGPKRSFSSSSSSSSSRGASSFRYSGPSHGGSSKPRTSIAGRRSSGPSRFSGGGGGGARRGGFKTERIDYAKFIKPAQKVEEKPYTAKHTFADFPFTEQLHKNIAKKGYTKPTPIQDQSIMPVLEGRDFFGLANTGTGKTGAFLLPMIDKTSRASLVKGGPKKKVIILAPTRELAQQIQEEFRSLSQWMNVFSVAAVGGLPITKQIQEIKRGVSFVIGTPGRVTDLIKRKALDLSEYSTVVLDEADRMLDMGFRDDMVFILGACAKERQTLFFSATLSPEIRKMTENYLVDPLFVSVVTQNTSKNIDQDVVRAHSSEKIGMLHDILIKDGADKVLIFRETKRSVDQLELELKGRGFKVGSIHGDKRNRERIRTLDSFKNNQISVLIATDVAARGLDIPNVTHVINYDIPNDYDTYVHRIGRTGRADKKGIALTFVPAAAAAR